MKILLTVDPEIPVPPKLYGGIERIVDLLVNSYVLRGLEVTLLANSSSKVPCRLIPWRGFKSQSLTDTFKNSCQLAALMYKEKFDLVHSFSRLAYMTPLMPLNIPKIMSYQREPSLSQIGKAVTLSKKNTLIFTGCSNYITDKIKTIANARTIYNCVPIEKYSCSTKIDEDSPLVFLGRIEEIKGTHLAVEVAQKTGKRLLIAGNIPTEGRQYFAEKVEPYLNERIKYIGAIDDQQKNDILGKALALLMPIQWNEPFGIVMVEAMACGTPVIAFPFGAVPEIIKNNVNGFICNSIEDMVLAITKVESLNRRRVREIVEENFSNDKIVEQYLLLYSTIAGVRGELKN